MQNPHDYCVCVWVALCVFMSRLVHSFPEGIYEHRKACGSSAVLHFLPTKGLSPCGSFDSVMERYRKMRECISGKNTHKEHKTKLPLETNSLCGRQEFFFMMSLCPAGLVWSVTSKLRTRWTSVPWSATPYMPLSAIPQVRIHCFVLCGVHYRWSHGQQRSCLLGKNV